MDFKPKQKSSIDYLGIISRSIRKYFIHMKEFSQ